MEGCGHGGNTARQHKVDNLAYDFASINASTVIDDASDLASYGFDAPPVILPLSLLTEQLKGLRRQQTPTGRGIILKPKTTLRLYRYSSKAEDFIALGKIP
jgi:hypothetical protein